MYFMRKIPVELCLLNLKVIETEIVEVSHLFFSGGLIVTCGSEYSYATPAEPIPLLPLPKN